jgi:hypothetical protein
MNWKFLLLIFSIISSCVFAPQLSSAQMAETFSQESLVVSTNPSFPNPFEPVTIELQDYGLTSPSRQIEWFINNVQQTNILNERVINVAAPGPNETMIIAARVITTSGEVFNASVRLRPQYLDLIVEPFTFAPPLYQGRPLPSFGSRVLITSLLHGENGLQNPNDYLYTWTLQNRVLNNGPLRGAFQQTITVPHGRNFLVGVTITNLRGEVIARRLLSLPSASVDLQFYEVNELLGFGRLALNESLTIFGNSTTIRAVPYNLDIFTSSTNLFTEWQINNRRQVSNPQNPFEITIVRSGSGRSEIRFRLRHLEALVQGGERRLNVLY